MKASYFLQAGVSQAGHQSASKLKVGSEVIPMPPSANASQALADAVRRAVVVLTETAR